MSLRGVSVLWATSCWREIHIFISSSGIFKPAACLPKAKLPAPDKRARKCQGVMSEFDISVLTTSTYQHQHFGPRGEVEEQCTHWDAGHLSTSSLWFSYTVVLSFVRSVAYLFSVLGFPEKENLASMRVDYDVVSVMPPWIHVFASVLELFGYHADFPMRSTCHEPPIKRSIGLQANTEEKCLLLNAVVAHELRPPRRNIVTVGPKRFRCPRPRFQATGLRASGWEHHHSWRQTLPSCGQRDRSEGLEASTWSNIKHEKLVLFVHVGHSVTVPACGRLCNLGCATGHHSLFMLCARFGAHRLANFLSSAIPKMFPSVCRLFMPHWE